MAADEGELLADCSLEVAGRRPATVRTLAAAAKCDVSVSAPVARDYGFSLDDRAGTSAAPDRFIRALAAGYDRQLHGESEAALQYVWRCRRHCGLDQPVLLWASSSCGPPDQNRL